MLAQQLVNGFALGAVYTLVALAFALVMGVLGVLNIAVAHTFMIGAFVAMSVLLLGWSVPSAIVAALSTGLILGLVVERIGYRPLVDAPPLMPLLATLGLGIFLEDVALNTWGSDPLQIHRAIMPGEVVIGGTRIAYFEMTMVFVAVALVTFVGWIVQRGSLGRALRAVAEDREVAEYLGISVILVTTATFAISGLLAGTAGSLISMYYGSITPFIGVHIALKGIAVMVVGGATNIWGALLAGPLLGITEVLAIAYGDPAYRDAVVWGLLIAVLLLRPQGLFVRGSEVVERV